MFWLLPAWRGLRVNKGCFYLGEAFRRSGRSAPLRWSIACGPSSLNSWATLFLQAVQDVSFGGRQEQRAIPIHDSKRQHPGPGEWGPLCSSRCGRCGSLPTSTAISKTVAYRPGCLRSPTASRLGITPQAIDNALYHAFGQRQSPLCTRIEPILRRDGSGPAVLAGPGRFEGLYVSSSTAGKFP